MWQGSGYNGDCWLNKNCENWSVRDPVLPIQSNYEYILKSIFLFQRNQAVSVTKKESTSFDVENGSKVSPCCLWNLAVVVQKTEISSFDVENGSKGKVWSC